MAATREQMRRRRAQLAVLAAHREAGHVLDVPTISRVLGLSARAAYDVLYAFRAAQRDALRQRCRLASTAAVGQVLAGELHRGRAA